MTLIPELESQLADAVTRQRPPRRLLRAAALPALGALAVCAAGIALILGDSTNDPAQAPPPPAPLRPAPAETGQVELTDLLGVFRRPATPRDDSGISIRELEATGDRQPGEDTTRSRRIDLPSGPVYLWPKKDGVCASWGNCLSLDSLRRLGIAVGVEGGGSDPAGKARFVVSGIVVDGIEAVRLVRVGVVEEVIPVTDNVFRVNAGKIQPLPTELRWHDDRGEHSFDFRKMLPPDSLP